jgi:hypothetical protein
LGDSRIGDAQTSTATEGFSSRDGDRLTTHWIFDGQSDVGAALAPGSATYDAVAKAYTINSAVLSNVVLANKAGKVR